MSYNPNVASESLANSQLTAVDTKASDLKRHRELVKEIKGKYLSGENNTQVNPDKVARQANVVKTEQSNVRNIMKLKFNWEKNQ